MCLTVSRARRGCGPAELRRRHRPDGLRGRLAAGGTGGTGAVAPGGGAPTWVGAAERLLNMVPPVPPGAPVCLVHQPSLSVPLSGSG